MEVSIVVDGEPRLAAVHERLGEVVEIPGHPASALHNDVGGERAGIWRTPRNYAVIVTRASACLIQLLYSSLRTTVRPAPRQRPVDRERHREVEGDRHR